MLLLNVIQEDLQAAGSEESVEKTLSIIELISSGGTAGILIIGILFVLLIVATYIYFERLFCHKSRL
jgi:biopolymer transport protein ExbB